MNTRDPHALAMLSAIVVVVAACGSAPTPGWTFAPTSSTAPSSPSPPAASPSAPGGSGPAPTAPAAPAGEVVRIAAKTIAFDQVELTVPAGRPFSLVFDNQESVSHNVAIYTDASAGQSLFMGEIFSGPAERTYAVPALSVGTYFYRCDVHPTQMTGTLVAG